MSSKSATETLLADAEGIARAARILRDGGLVAVPTETVYGLAARADDAEAVAKIYAAKGRPDFNPLIVHVRDLEQARGLGEFGEAAENLAKEHWPGPLTLVLPAKSEVRIAPSVTAGLQTVALRMPQHPVMRALLAECDFPLAAPSANRSGYISPTKPEHVLASLDGRIDLLLDGGNCATGLESTIAAVRENGTIQLLRPGPTALDTADYPAKGIEAPGQLASHYSPGKPVRLKAAEAEMDEFMIGFGRVGGDCNLSISSDLNEAAANLYDLLHQAAASEKPRIAVAAILEDNPDASIARAINDRLRRAAAPKN